ncbi:MAG: purine-nucleoside phosphorylase [Acidobacteria bacterium]|nr:purine-nucleoside phosphorylase [Acidobacteriota bacterium]
MLGIRAQVEETVAAIRRRWGQEPSVGIILGTGLRPLAERVSIAAEFDYADLPHFPRSTVAGHAGRLLAGTLAQRQVLVMEGRFHRYEGWSMAELTYPVRVMRALGCELLVVSNASGGLNPAYGSSDIMVIEDHINMFFDSPLFGINDDELGPRFPDMSAPYAPELIEAAMRAARGLDYVAHKGVYAGFTGPSFETRAEYRMLRGLGADAVGMSTVPEVIAAVHAGMRVLGLSVITNLCRPDCLEETGHEEVLAAADRASPAMTRIVEAVLAERGPTA